MPVTVEYGILLLPAVIVFSGAMVLDLAGSEIGGANANKRYEFNIELALWGNTPEETEEMIGRIELAIMSDGVLTGGDNHLATMTVLNSVSVVDNDLESETGIAGTLMEFTTTFFLALGDLT